ncbi:MAG: rhamnulokinase [Clostridiales bacterium]|nr:rhamnulokinase [Gammaproteobacteria bacterium]PID82136.1 MAG: rhamnulokinase [Clostridiales bacterium]
MNKVLAVDMGATSIRGILGFIENGELKMQEVMRLSHDIVEDNGRQRWQWDKLINAIVETIDKYSDEIVSVGIDTWGVDFGLLDKEGNLLETPIAYRDPKHQDGYNTALEKLNKLQIFANTGTQIMTINTLFQVLAFKEFHKDNFQKADKMLMLPDLIQYMLTGEMVGEETIWSTSQIMNLKDRSISNTIIDAFDINKDIFPTIVKAGHLTGNTKNAKIEKLRKTNIDVVSVCGHDTASAVLMTKANSDKDYMFLSCGTWSLIGAKVDEADLSEKAYEEDMTNELGYDSSTLLFKNITGLYLLEKYKKQLEVKLSRTIEFDEITEYVLNSYKEKPETDSILDVADARFGADDINAKEAITSYLTENGLSVPENDMDYFRVIYESLVQKYYDTKQSLEKITGKTYKKLHMIGGGAKSSLLCELISKKLGVELIAGPFEASALGNILIQLKAQGEIEDMQSGISLALKSQKTKLYQSN